MTGATLLTIAAPDAATATGGPGYAVADFAAPQVRITDLAVTRGDGVFETIAVIDGRPQSLGPHLIRLAHSAALLDLPAPAERRWHEAVLAGVADYRERNGAERELYAKLIYTRGVEGEGRPSGWVLVDRGEDFTQQRLGIRVVTLDRGLRHDVAETSPWLLAGAKTLSYAVNRAAQREAVRRGADDAIFLSSDGYALEGPTSNLLLLTGGAVVTPQTDQGILAGTTQAAAFAFFEERGQKTEYRRISVKELFAADALWLVSSVRQAAPITQINGKKYPVDAVLTANLNKYLLERTY
ncbi:branched-chain amino acid aminotransferase [Leifsonia xyli subsp. xyli]|uniref:Branched-chain amino acid aminotransferase n=2 Tax=Leifsonia xyli subsp. xyli TaxID=59736 RepID=Q6ADN2_LEIXX|nr:aminodeoxychorismate lyase [Leifsonia xyli]AAT89514.1 branched-chain amino acid aminotransferase [Leifsonia xyli subsp. xyli str. CTCB07]ODA91373.1 branched-chain amino acid aminotransferase [Leifsonia xyli subsp. xyli]